MQTRYRYPDEPPEILEQNGHHFVALNMNDCRFLINPHTGFRIRCTKETDNSNPVFSNMSDEEFTQALCILDKQLNDRDLLDAIRKCDWKLAKFTNSSTYRTINLPRKERMDSEKIYLSLETRRSSYPLRLTAPPEIKMITLPGWEEARIRRALLENQTENWLKNWSLFSKADKELLVNNRHVVKKTG